MGAAACLMDLKERKSTEDRDISIRLNIRRIPRNIYSCVIRLAEFYYVYSIVLRRITSNLKKVDHEKTQTAYRFQ